jgi:protein-tyrosine phosphatase
MIDLHSHPLPGLDDGVPDLAAGVELVRAAAEAGVTTIAATPHVREDFPTSAAEMEDRVRALREALGPSAAIDVATGAEVAATYLQRVSDDDLVRLTLGGSGRYLLTELPDLGWSIGIELALQRLSGLGIRPLLAHPERNDLVQERPARLETLVDSGALVQVTARATRPQYGRRTSETAAKLLRLGLVHVVASDAHAAPREGQRSPWEVHLSDTVREQVCVSNPAAILRGEEVRPVQAGSRSLFRRSRRAR